MWANNISMKTSLLTLLFIFTRCHSSKSTQYYMLNCFDVGVIFNFYFNSCVTVEWDKQQWATQSPRDCMLFHFDGKYHAEAFFLSSLYLNNF